MNICAKILQTSGAGVAALALAFGLKAAPVEYIFTGAGSGTFTPGPAGGGIINQSSFTNDSITVEFFGDTSNVIPNINGGSSGPPGIVVFSSASIDLGGTTYALPLNLTGFNALGVYYNVNANYVGFQENGFDVFNIQNPPGISASALTSNYGPQTGTLQSIFTNTLTDTSGDQIFFTGSSLTGLTFQSIVTPSGAPDRGETILLLTLALAAIGLVRFRTGQAALN